MNENNKKTVSIQHNFWQRKTTARDIKKATQLEHTKKKLHEMKDKRSNKKDNLVKSLKNLMKRAKRKGV